MASDIRLHVVPVLLAMVCAGAAHAQIVTTTPAIPEAKAVSPGGVDMRTGDFAVESPDLSIGAEGGGGFTFLRVPNKTMLFTSNWHYKMSKKPSPSGGNYYQIENQAIAKTFFSATGTTFTEASLVPDGISKLQLFGSGSSQYFILTAPDGTTTRFQPAAGGVNTWAEEIKRPDGVTYTFAYDTGGPSLAPTRPRRVTSNTGYQMVLEFFASPNNGKVSKVCVFNSAFTTPPVAHVCPAGSASVSYTYVGNRVTSVTDAAGAVSTITSNYVNSTTPFQESFYKPGIGQAWLTNSYLNNTGLYVGLQSFAGGQTVSYNFDWIGQGEIGSGAVFLGLGWTDNSQNETLLHWKTYQVDPQHLPAVSAGPDTITDPLGRVTKTTFDGSFTQILGISQPSGLKANYSYNVNRNISQVQQTPTTGSSDLALTVGYTYDCTFPLNCKKPATMTDARGNTTNYTYDPTHGGLLTETLPAPSAGAVRPQKRYTWSQHYAWYRNTSGALVQAVTPVWLVDVVSECRTLSSCSGTADETRTTFSYGANGVPNNLLVTQSTVAAGDGSISATKAFAYNAAGDKLSEDGPVPGGADTTVWKYDVLRRAIGVIGPDPDGAGPRLYRASRSTYDPAGRPVKLERGTTLGQSDADWAAFASITSIETDYDLLDRQIKVTQKGGATGYAVTQYSYDAFGRLECTAVRMNPAVFGSLPSSACDPSTAGVMGPDRITRNYYDAAGQITKTQIAVSTTDIADDVTNTYTVNSRLETVTDAENNRTTFEYDGHDRLKKTRFPVPTQGQLTSSTTDYEQFAYDANGNKTQRQLRDGQVINFSYDYLNRVTSKTLPAPEVVVSYTDYDLQGHLKSVSQGNTLTMSWDALGRNRSETSSLGTMLFDYDEANRRTKTTWPDGFYISHGYFATGEVSEIRENTTTPGSNVLAYYSYDDLGRRGQIARSNGTYTNYSYDGISRLSGLSHNLTATASDVALTFTHNPANQLVTSTRDNDAYAWGGHFNLNRAYAVDGLNKVTSAGGNAVGYDARGNVQTIDGNYFSYTAENRLTSAFAVATLVYDAAGRLFVISTASTHSRLQYDGPNLIGEYDSSNILQRRYVHGPGVDEPLVWYEGGGTSDRRWYHQDERGSVIAVSNNAGSVIATNTYDEYGVPGATNLGRFQYTGQTWIPELGLAYYKARMYAPRLGRFLQTDPAGYDDGMNLYAYSNMDPVNLIDPTGQYSFVVARLLSSPGAVLLLGHSFVVTNARYIGDPNAKLYSFGPLANGNTGNITNRSRASAQAVDTSKDDWAAWLAMGIRAPTANIAQINAPDATVDAVAQNIDESTPYSLTPHSSETSQVQSENMVVSIPTPETNSNSAAFAVGDTSEQIATGDPTETVDRGAFSLFLPGMGASKKIKIHYSPCTGSHIHQKGC